MERKIGTLSETSLHAALKRLYARPDDRLEWTVDGYVVDVAHLAPPERKIGEGGGDYLTGEEPEAAAIVGLTEIQTGNFGGMRRKLEKLLPRYSLRLVYPLAVERYILRIAKDGAMISRRKSPYQGAIEGLFYELVALPGLALHPNLTLEVALIVEEQVWRDDGQGSWRRKHWSLADRRLVEVRRRVVFQQPQDYLALLPGGLPETFGSQALASALAVRGQKAANRRLAGKMLYCLRQMSLIEVVSKQGKAYQYRVKA